MQKRRLLLQLQHRMNKGPAYHVGLRLAVVALRVEAALVLASGRGRLEVRRDCARGHDVSVWGKVRRRRVEQISKDSGLVLKQQESQGLCWRGVDVGQERASNQQDELG
jgi:hypothetical protein